MFVTCLHLEFVNLVALIFIYFIKSVSTTLSYFHMFFLLA